MARRNIVLRLMHSAMWSLELEVSWIFDTECRIYKVHQRIPASQSTWNVLQKHASKAPIMQRPLIDIRNIGSSKQRCRIHMIYEYHIWVNFKYVSMYMYIQTCDCAAVKHTWNSEILWRPFLTCSPWHAVIWLLALSVNDTELQQVQKQWKQAGHQHFGMRNRGLLT